MALCLSGGGLRATFFHLGLVRFLADAGYLNSHSIQMISSVSGGSIMAAHLVKNWSLYTNPKTFEAAAADLIAFGQSDLRGRVVRRSLIRYLARCMPLGDGRKDWRSNTNLLMREYRRLFSTTSDEILRRYNGLKSGPLASQFAYDGQLDLISLPYDPQKHAETERPPFLVMHASCLNSGEIFSFSRNGVDIHRERRTAGGVLTTRDPEVLHPCPDDSIRFSTAVAASSAFPLFFSPLEVAEDNFPTAWAKLRQTYDGASLTDGGVYDNLGVRGARNYSEVRDIDTFIISNAGAAFDWQSRKHLTQIPLLRLIRRILRASDILTKRVRDMELEHLDHELWQLGVDQSRSVGFSIEDILPTRDGPQGGCDETALPMAWQRQLAYVRTDLDAFDDVVLAALIQHGYTVARWGFLQHGLEVPNSARGLPWCPDRLRQRLDEMKAQSRASGRNSSGNFVDQVHQHLCRQSERRLGLFTRQDWLSRVYAAAFILVLLGATLFAALAIQSIIEVWLTPGRPTLEGRWHYSVDWTNGGQRVSAQGYCDIFDDRRTLVLRGMRTNANEGMVAPTMPPTSPWIAPWAHVDETRGGYQLVFDYRATNATGFGGLVTALARAEEDYTVMAGLNIRLWPGLQQGQILMLKQLPDGRLAVPKPAAAKSIPRPVPTVARTVPSLPTVQSPPQSVANGLTPVALNPANQAAPAAVVGRTNAFPNTVPNTVPIPNARSSR